VHKAVAADFLPKLEAKFAGRVKLHADERAFDILKKVVSTGSTTELLPATDADFGNEYLDYECCIKVVDSIEEAIEYILANPDSSENIFSEKSDNLNLPNAKNFIGKWNCPCCTYENNGLEKCEMCETKIPEDIYNKFLNNYTKGIPNEKKPEPKKEEKKEIKEVKGEKKDLNLMEDNDVVYKDVLIKNIHITYDPYNSDPFCPFVLVAILFNYV
jgi:hypothetical protein